MYLTHYHDSSDARKSLQVLIVGFFPCRSGLGLCGCAKEKGSWRVGKGYAGCGFLCFLGGDEVMGSVMADWRAWRGSGLVSVTDCWIEGIARVCACVQRVFGGFGMTYEGGYVNIVPCPNHFKFPNLLHCKLQFHTTCYAIAIRHARRPILLARAPFTFLVPQH